MLTNICIITGTRAEFGIFRPVLRAIQASKKLRLQLLVTGMHLQRAFGHTIDDITRENFPIAAKVPMYKANEPPAASLARATAGIAKAFLTLKPHLVMVLGDRLEILAAANAALACQLPLAHLHGGETAPGQWDEQIRHAVTKMAQLHFCATKKSGQRIAQMGENPKNIHVVGAPALDYAVCEAKQNRSVRLRGRNESDPLLLLHPSSPDDDQEYSRAKMLVQLIVQEKPSYSGRLVVIGPNNDPGYRGILRAYREFPKEIQLTMSCSQDMFWTFLETRGLLVGNSSAGILEAATFGCAVINLGERQAGRERNANVIDVAWKAGARGIQSALKHAYSASFQSIVAQRQNLYGDGHASQRILKILESQKFPLPTTKIFHSPTS